MDFSAVTQMLSYVAQTERGFVRQRQAEGIAAAKAQGVRFGRPPLVQPKEFPAVHQAWRNQNHRLNRWYEQAL